MFTAYFSIANASIIEPAFANIGSGSTGSGANLARVTITSSNFKNITVHRSVDRDGLSKIEPVEKKTTQPGQTRVFKRGGYRLILMQPKIGKSIPLRMKLQSAGKRQSPARPGVTSEIFTKMIYLTLPVLTPNPVSKNTRPIVMAWSLLMGLVTPFL